MTAAPAAEDSTDLFAQAEQRLDAAVVEAQALRYVEGLPDPALGAREVLRRLSLVRSRLDEVDELLIEVSRFRTGTRVLFKEAAARAEDRWAEQVASTGGRRRSAFGSEMEGPRERYARADLATMEDRRVARARERTLDAVTDAYNVIDAIRRGLESVRMDLHALLRFMSAPEHRLDRTSL